MLNEQHKPSQKALGIGHYALGIVAGNHSTLRSLRFFE